MFLYSICILSPESVCDKDNEFDAEAVYETTKWFKRFSLPRSALLGLESLELRRRRLDLIFTYKVICGFTGLRADDFVFKLGPERKIRMQPYRLLKPRCIHSTRCIFLVLGW